MDGGNVLQEDVSTGSRTVVTPVAHLDENEIENGGFHVVDEGDNSVHI